MPKNISKDIKQAQQRITQQKENYDRQELLQSIKEKYHIIKELLDQRKKTFHHLIHQTTTLLSK